MKIAFNPLGSGALTKAPDNKDITFDLVGRVIYARGVSFDGKNTLYKTFKKHTSSDNTGGSEGLVPIPSYSTTNTRLLREDGLWVNIAGAAPPDTELSTESTNAVQNKVITNKINEILASMQLKAADVYKNIKVGTTTLVASGVNDTLEFKLGNGITITPNATNKTLEFSINATGNLGISTSYSNKQLIVKILDEYYNKWNAVYDWYISVTEEDTDDLINKWQEIVDFLNSVAEGTDILDEFVTRKTAQTITGVKTFNTQLKFTVADGTSPFTVTSKTLVTNLNADLLDGQHGSRYTRALGGPNYVTITVGGDAATYYPVVISAVSDKYPMLFVNISRGYSETAPSSWNTATHKGGLTLTLLWNGSKYWDGNGSGGPCYVVYVYQSYCTMVGGFGNSTSGKVVWLRGGGAVYHIHAMNGTSVSATVYTSTYTDSASLSFAPRTTVASYSVRWPGDITGSSASVRDAGNSTAITLKYSSGGFTSNPSYLAAWNGYQITYVAPSYVTVGRASIADKLGSSTVGGTYQPIYLSSGTATAGTSYAKAIKTITRSGTTFTYTCIDGTTGTFTLLDNNTTYYVYGKTINASYKTAYRTLTGRASGYYLAAIRCDTASVAEAPLYGSGIAFGMADTHGYLYMNYSSAYAYIGAGNADKLNWTATLLHSSNSSVSGGGSAGGSSITVKINNTSKTLTIPTSLPANGGTSSYTNYLKIHDVRGTNHLPNSTTYPEKNIAAWFNNTGTPDSSWWSGITVRGWTSTYAVWQLCSYSSTGTANNYRLYHRNGINGGWGSWKTIAYTSDIPSVGNGTVTIKQAGTTKGSFTMNQSGNTTIELTDNNTTYSFTNNNPTLSWGTKSTIGTVGGVALTVTMPANPNTNTHWTTRIYAGASGTAANAAATNPYLKVTDDNTYRNLVRFVGGGATTVSSDASGNITISSTNTTYSFAAKGSATQGIYLSGTNTFAAMTYSLKATVNAGTAGKLAYYSGANAISAYTSTVGDYSTPVYINGGVPVSCYAKSVGSVTWGTNCSGYIYVYQFGPITILLGYISKIQTSNTSSTNYVFKLPSGARSPSTSCGFALVQKDGYTNDRNTVIRLSGQYGYCDANYNDYNPVGASYYFTAAYM